jgi:ferredoxin-NADP reductase
MGVEIAGSRRWRSYSLSSPPRADGRLAVTVKAHPGGLVSPHLVHHIGRGAIVGLSGPFGAFVLPDVLPERMLFLTAGSGITPVMAILRQLAAGGRRSDVVVVHSCPSADRMIFGAELRAIARQGALRLQERHTSGPGASARLGGSDLGTLCPDWAARSTWACGPQGLLDELERFWRQAGRGDQLHVERFGLRRRSAAGAGGRVRFTRSRRQADADGDTTLAQVAERAGVAVPDGCRAGVCRSCVARLDAGRVRDLQTGAEHAAERQLIRTCVSAALGAVDLDL